MSMNAAFRVLRHTSSGRACAVLLALIVGVACGAGTKRSRVETPASASMAGYRTYAWWRPPLGDGPRGYTEDEDRFDSAVRQLVDSELAARGYRSTDNRPEFVLRYGASLYEKPTQPFRDYLTYYVGGVDLGAAHGAPAGTFTLEAIDVKTRRVAWRTTAPAVVGPGPSATGMAPAIRQMMDSLPQRP